MTNPVLEMEKALERWLDLERDLERANGSAAIIRVVAAIKAHRVVAEAALSSHKVAGWRPIAEAPKDGVWAKVDLFLSLAASPRSMGFSDAFRVPDCWWDETLGGWVHYHKDVPTALHQEYVTHFMPLPSPPAGEKNE